jgi:hypothetical protein
VSEWRDLTPGQRTELDAEVREFLTNRMHEGLACVVLVEGRGVARVGYFQDITPDPMGLLARGFNQVEKNIKANTN